MKRFIGTLVACALVLSASAALAQTDEAKLAALKAQRSKLDREVRRKLYREYSKLRYELSNHKDLAALKKQLKQAEEAYNKKVKDDAKVQAAAKEEQAARDALRQAGAKAVAGDTTLARMKRDLMHTERSLFDTEATQRLARFQLDEVRRRIAAWDDDVRQTRKASAKVERAYRDLMKDKALWQARYAADRAKRVYEGRLRYGPGRRTRKESEGKDLPEYRAWQQAEQAFDVLLKSDENRALVKAQAAAQKAEREAVDKAFETDDEAVALRKKLEQAKAAEKIDQEEIRSIRNKMMEAEQDIHKKDPAVAEVRKAWEEAYRAHHKVAEQQASKEEQAVRKARMELYRKTGELVAADPRGAALQKEMQKVSAQLNELDKQIWALSGRPKRGPTTRRSGTRPKGKPRKGGEPRKGLPAAGTVVKPKPPIAAATQPAAKAKPVTKQQQIDRQCKQWLSLAESYLQARKPDRAKQYLQLIILGHPGTVWAAKARTRLAGIDATSKDSSR